MDDRNDYNSLIDQKESDITLNKNYVKLVNNGSRRDFYHIDNISDLRKIRDIYETLRYFDDRYYFESGSAGKEQLKHVGLTSVIDSDLDFNLTEREDINPLIGKFRLISYTIFLKSTSDKTKFIKFLPLINKI
jgi:hypothetical protein